MRPWIYGALVGGTVAVRYIVGVASGELVAVSGGVAVGVPLTGGSVCRGGKVLVRIVVGVVSGDAVPDGDGMGAGVEAVSTMTGAYPA